MKIAMGISMGMAKILKCSFALWHKREVRITKKHVLNIQATQ
jgi:hypothetical protein